VFMSRRIFLDCEEAISREIRRISFDENRTKDHIVMQDVFDPFTGTIMQTPMQPRFYDSSADTHNIQYPHIFVKLLKSREDRFTGRVVPPYGQDACVQFKETSPRAYSIVFNDIDGLISTTGGIFTTSSSKVARIQAGQLLRILNGNNKGTYTIASVAPQVPGPHQITVSNNIVENLPSFIFDASQRVAIFVGTDLSTVKIGDNFVDSLLTTFPITAIDAETGYLTVGGIGLPDASSGSVIQRVGPVFTNTDLTGVSFLVLDPSKPVTINGSQATTGIVGKSPQIPIDAYYLVRIDSKERATHIDILNRVWEEFNPPRTGLPVIVRTSDSAEQLLTADIVTGGSTNVFVSDTSKFNVGDQCFIINDFEPTKSDYGFQTPFEATVIGKVSTTQLVLSIPVPDTFKVADSAKIVSNAYYRLLMFHFVNHDTKDVEGAQYWVHEFTFWVQVWVDRLETARESDNPVLDISTPIEINGITIISDR
jgi:hypothetical protein